MSRRSSSHISQKGSKRLASKESGKLAFSTPLSHSVVSEEDEDETLEIPKIKPHKHKRIRRPVDSAYITSGGPLHFDTELSSQHQLSPLELSKATSKHNYDYDQFPGEEEPDTAVMDQLMPDESVQKKSIVGAIDRAGLENTRLMIRRAMFKEESVDVFGSRLSIRRNNVSASASETTRSQILKDQDQKFETLKRMLTPTDEPDTVRQPAPEIHLESNSQQEDLEIDCGPQLPEYKGLLFDDGVRQIDYVLVYEEKREKRTTTDAAVEEQDRSIELSRKKYLMGLLKAGVEMERAVQFTPSTVINYIKLHMPFTVLCAYAEHLNFKAPLQECDRAADKSPMIELWLDSMYRILHITNPHVQEVPNKPTKYYTCKFKAEKLDKFLGGNRSSREKNFFPSTQRTVAIYQILKTTSYGKSRNGEIGIEPLLEDNVFTAAYPLHDSGADGCDESIDPLNGSRMRPVLSKYWANYNSFCKYQPLHHIRDYFGERIGLYFAWLGFYTSFLFPAAFIGLMVFLYGIISFKNDIVINDICTSGMSYKMCPTCEGCDYYYLSHMCLFMKVGYLSDHPGTVFYAVVMSLWAAFFLQFWQRKVARIAFDWDCLDVDGLDEQPRPDYINLAPERAKNPITGLVEPYFSKAKRKKRMVGSGAFIIIMMTLVLVFILACIIYKVLVSMYLAQIPWKSEQLKQFSSMFAAGSGSVLNLVLILIVGAIYEVMALKLTQWEMHRTQVEFDDSYIKKTFIFQFVNYYSSIFYVGFFKGKFVGHPGNYWTVLGLRNEECLNGGCMIELAVQLLIIMIGIQIFNNIIEIILPLLNKWWQARSVKDAKSSDKITQRWEADYLLPANEGLFSEYLEMTLQFGFITIFAAACPLAPLFALLNNLVEIRLDAKKFVAHYRRPITERAQNIGAWEKILHFIAHLAVISNAFLIAFTSEFLPRQYYKYTVDDSLTGYVNFTLAVSQNLSEPCRYKDFRDSTGTHTSTYWEILAIRLLFVVVFEHFVFGVVRLIDLLVPDIPLDLFVMIKREQYLAKQALADNEAALLLAKQQEEEDDEDNIIKIPSA